MIARDRGRQRLSGAVMALGLALPAVIAGSGLLPACTTDTPREHFGVPYSAVSGGSGPMSGGSGGASAGSSAQGGSIAEAGMGGDDSGGSSGSGGSGGGGLSTYDCGPRPVSEGVFSTEALRAAAADCAIWHYSCFEGAASVMAEVVGDWVEDPTPEKGELARAAWRDAMGRWSEVELFQFGPIASPVVAAAKDKYRGQSLREPIYSWPNTARCRVEDLIINQAYLSPTADVVMSGRGLFALEYLLFNADGVTVCAPASATAQTWGTLSNVQLGERKRDYALWLGADIHTRATGIVQRWRADGENFRQEFIDAAGYPDPAGQNALTVLAWALLYIEHETKDLKLAGPAGISPTPIVPESPFAGVRTENIRHNLRAFRSLFQGCGENGEGMGFDDWLSAANNSDLAARMIAELDQAQVAFDGLPPLQTASAAEALVAYEALRDLTTLLKTEFLVALNFELPEAIGDDTD